MKALFIVVTTMFLAACGGHGGGADSSAVSQPPSQVDHTPHDYNVVMFSDNAPTAAMTFHQVCNFGLANFRDDGVQSDSFSYPFANQFGFGASACANYTVDLTNTGAYPVMVEISVDGHALPDFTLSPSQHFTFQRGF